MRFAKRMAIAAVIVLLAVTASVFYFLSPVSRSDDKVERITIPPASSSSDIGDILYEKGLIKNTTAFKIFTRATGVAGDFGSGTYDLKKSMNMNQIINKIVSGAKGGDIKLTIPEGSEIKHIAEILRESGLKDVEGFIELTKKPELFVSDYSFLKDVPKGYTLEGYLYPETYYLDREDMNDPELVIRKMLDNFEANFSQEIQEKGKKLDLNVNQIVTMASLIEREAKDESDRPLVSAVFYNRIKKGMYLESCASVQYILGERKPILSLEDIDIDSPYNTYRNGGLPPAPIASAGIKSLEAAVNPADVDYLFFIAKGDESHVFSSTFEEHLKVQKELQQ